MRPPVWRPVLCPIGTPWLLARQKGGKTNYTRSDGFAQAGLFWSFGWCADDEKGGLIVGGKFRCEVARPVWLLDVDGVLNAYARGRALRASNSWEAWHPVDNRLPGFTGPAAKEPTAKAVPYMRRDVNTTPASDYAVVFRLFVHPGVVAFVHRMLDCGVDVRWCTTWEHSANELLGEPFGLPTGLPVEHSSADDPHWKGTAARFWADAGHPVVWTDDDAIRSVDRVWLQERSLESGVGHLLIEPHALHGLTPGDCHEIEQFVRACPDD